jgi:hypothetical protein
MYSGEGAMKIYQCLLYKSVYRVLLLVCFIVLTYTPLFSSDAVPADETSEIRAVSVKALQMKLKESQAESAELNRVKQVEGITRIMGCVLDKDGGDVILYGSTDPGLPPLYIDDFVVALRNVQLHYAEFKKNTYLYTYPGCSIDPDPRVMGQLNQLNLNSGSGSDKIKKDIEKWHEIGKQPQKVRVLGIPFHTRYGKIMVEADYFMKRLVDGSVALDIDGFISLADLNVNKLKEDIIQNRPLSFSTSLNRFWFFPGKNLYSRSGTIVMINECPVVLLTEEEYVTDNESIQGTGKANPLASEFTDRFTYYYDFIAVEKPVFAELRGLFTWFALAKIIDEQGFFDHLDLDYLLNKYNIPGVTVEKELPGITNVKYVEHKMECEGGYQIYQLYLPTCGGVSMELDVNDNNFISQKTGELSALQQVILDSRTKTDAVAWDIPGTTSRIEEVHDFIADDDVISVEKADAGYYNISHKSFELDKEAAHQGQLVEIIDETAGKIPPDKDIKVHLHHVTSHAEAVCFVKSWEFEARKKIDQLKHKNIFERIIWFFSGRTLQSLDFARAQISGPVKTSITTESGETREVTTFEITIPRMTRGTGKVMGVNTRYKGTMTSVIIDGIKNTISTLFGKAAWEKKNINWVADHMIKEIKGVDPGIEDVSLEFSDREFVDNPVNAGDAGEIILVHAGIK